MQEIKIEGHEEVTGIKFEFNIDKNNPHWIRRKLKGGKGRWFHLQHDKMYMLEEAAFNVHALEDVAQKYCKEKGIEL